MSHSIDDNGFCWIRCLSKLTPILFMPELPEVEVTRQSFASRIEGATVQSVSLGKPLRWPLGIETEQLGSALTSDPQTIEPGLHLQEKVLVVADARE